METNTTTAPTTRSTTSRAFRAISTAVCAAAFIAALAFGGPDDNASRWDADIDAHSEVGFEVALDTNTTLGE